MKTVRFIVVGALALIGLAALLVGGRVAYIATDRSIERYDDILDHYKYASIGTEQQGGVPYWIWRALPSMYPDVFGEGGYRDGRAWEEFGFFFEDAPNRDHRDLPFGFALSREQGVDVTFMNCALCHSSTYRLEEEGPREIALGAYNSQFDIYRFVRFLFSLAIDPRFHPDAVMAAMEAEGARFGPIERLYWRYAVLPLFREELIRRRAEVHWYMEQAAPGGPLGMNGWGPGRVETLNLMKLTIFGYDARAMTDEEFVGVAKYPPAFNQGPREGMKLHWDGNNDSVRERNLAAAISDGAFKRDPDAPNGIAYLPNFENIFRLEPWLADLAPPPSPHRPDPALVALGKPIYMDLCADCHGFQGEGGFVFEDERVTRIGEVTPLAEVGTSTGRHDTLTARFGADLLTVLEGTEHQFRRFKKSEGYANHPLDGLWLRAPYLHNGSVPTLRDLLRPPAERPRTFLRGGDVIDYDNGGFVAPPCEVASTPEDQYCQDASVRGNGNQGHLWGTDLDDEAKEALLAYLLTF